MVFSAGNAGPGPGTITAPKEAKNLIVVGNARSEGRPVPQIDSMAPSSSRGPALDGRILPTVVAPGDSVASTRRIGGARLLRIADRRERAQSRPRTAPEPAWRRRGTWLAWRYC